MEAVDLVLHAHIKRRGDGAFPLVAVDTQVAVGVLVLCLDFPCHQEQRRAS